MTLAERQQRFFAAITRPDPGAATPGVAIYRNAYRTRLIETLREMFPALLHALGAELFEQFAAGFITHDPPRGPTLERLASEFPRHLAATAPDEPWTRFILELAELESAFRRMYDAADPAPAVFRFAYPCGEYLNAVRRGGTPELPAPRATILTMRRVRFRVLITSEYALPSLLH